MNPTFILLPIIAALAQGQQPITQEQQELLAHYELSDPATRQVKAAEMLSAVTKSLAREIVILDSLALNGQYDGCEDDEDLRKTVTRSPFSDAYNNAVSHATIVPTWQTNGYIKRLFVANPLSGMQHAYLIFKEVHPHCLQKNLDDSVFFKFPLKNNAGYISFAREPKTLQTQLELLNAVKHLKAGARPATTKIINLVAIPRIHTQLTDSTQEVLELHYEGAQVLTNDNSDILFDSDPKFGFMANRPDFIISPRDKTLCWIDNCDGDTTFAALCNPSTYSNTNHVTSNFTGSLTDFPN